MLLAQISDLHVGAPEGPVFVDPHATLSATLAFLDAMSARPDLLVLSGDLTHDGTPEQYAMLDAILEGIEVRMALLPGNHDDSAVMRAELAHRLPDELADGHLSYVIDDAGVRLVVFDTTHPERHDGFVSDGRLDWLQTTLAESDRPTSVAMHHPPFETGLRWMDLALLDRPDAFVEVIAANPHVRHVMCGHMHRPIQTTLGAALVTVCPSTSQQLALRLEPGGAGLTNEPPGFLLHRWTGGNVVSHGGLVWDGVDVDVSHIIAKYEATAALGEGFHKRDFD